MNEMDELSVTTVLMCLPEWVESQVLEEWLSLHFLPLVLQHLPQAVVSGDTMLYLVGQGDLVNLCLYGNFFKGRQQHLLIYMFVFSRY